jgi:transcription antitermination factor NusG
MSCELDKSPLGARWFAVSARARHERLATAMLDALGVTNFLPLATQLRQWSDRKQLVMLPLFPGYLFVRINLLTDSTLPILKVPGIVGLVKNNTGPLPIPDQQISDVRRVLAQQVQCSPHPFTPKEGDRVRIVRGALGGLEGTLVRTNSETWFVLSIDMIQRSIAVRVSRRDVEPAATGLTLADHYGELACGAAKQV